MNLETALGDLLERRVADGIGLWRRARQYLQFREAYLYRFPAGNALLALADYGTAGLAELEGVYGDPSAPPESRIQAGLILMRHGRREITDQVLHLWELYRGRDRYLYGRVPEALLVLLMEGHLELAGVVIERANRMVYQDDDPWSYWYSFGGFTGAVMGTSAWNTGFVEVLKRATGEDFGWDLRAWTRWWEREKVRLAGGN
jgi:hypothetical protein